MYRCTTATNDTLDSSTIQKTKRTLSELLGETEPDDLTLTRALGFLVHEKTDGMADMPSYFKCGIDANAENYIEARDSVLKSIGNDPFRFLFFCTPSLIKDFSRFRTVLSNMDLFDEKFATEATIRIAVCTADFLKSKKAEDKIEGKELVQICNVINKHNPRSVMSEKYSEAILQSFQAYADPDLMAMLSNKRNINCQYAFDVVHQIKDELAITSIEDQLEACLLFYIHSKSKTADELLGLLGENFIRMTFSKNIAKKGLRYNNGKRKKAIAACQRTKECLTEFTSPLDLLCVFSLVSNGAYKRKADNTIGLERRPKTSDSAFESGLIYERFTRSLNDGDDVAIILPSPFFIWKWLHDPMVSNVRALFVVSSDTVRKLIEYQFNEWHGVDELQCNEVAISTIERFCGESDKTNEFDSALVLYTTLDGPIPIENPAATITKRLGKCKSIWGFGPESSIKKSGSFANSLAMDSRFRIDSILFPSLIGNSISHPKKKCLFIAMKSKSNDQETRLMRIERTSNDLLTICREERSLQLKELLSGDKSLRSIWSIHKETVDVNGTYQNPSKREKAHKISFSKDIPFYYTFSEVESEKGKNAFRVVAFVKDVEGRKVNTSIRRKDLFHRDDIERWVLEDYPNSAKYSRKTESLGSTSIKETIQTTFKRTFEDSKYRIGGIGPNGLRKPPEECICLKSLLFVYEKELKKEIGNDQFPTIKEFVYSLPLNDRRIDELSLDDYINAFGTSKNDSTIFKNLIGLSTLLDFARRQGFCIENALDEHYRELGRELYMRTAMREVLATKTLTERQDKELFKYLSDRIESGEYIYTGVLIKFLTGLETSIIRALTWEDFFHIERFGFYQLQVYRQVVEEEGKLGIKPLKDLTDFRCIPCCDKLCRILVKLRDKQKITLELASKRFIVQNEETQGTKPVGSQELRDAIRTSLKRIGADGDGLEGLDCRSTDLTRMYRGDMLRENFRFMSMEFSRMSADETAFILGNVPETTAALHYLDFRNDVSQFILYGKLRRLDPFLEGRKAFMKPKPSTRITSNETTTTTERQGCFSPRYVNIVLNKKKGSCCSIHAEARFGIDIQIGEEILEYES